MNAKRRAFLTVSAGAMAAWLSPRGTLAAETGANKRVGLIGCGWYGTDLHRTLDRDAAAHQVRGDAEANGRLARAYRTPWGHP